MQASTRKLKANPARALALIQQGQRVQITSHRKVVSELIQPTEPTAHESPPSDEEAMQRLFASGLIAEPATKPFKLGKAVVFAPGPNGQTMSDLVLDMRGPR